MPLLAWLLMGAMKPKEIPSAAFLDALGVATHFGQDWRSYRPRYREVAAKLAELGARHIRDGLDPRPEVAAIHEELATKWGIRSLLLVGPRVASKETWRGRLDPGAIPTQLEIMKRLYPRSLEAIEGPNEYDVTSASPEAGIGDPDWPKGYADFTRRLYAAMKADPALRKIRVLNGPMAMAFNAAKPGDLSASLDGGSFHPYPGGGPPSQGLGDYNVPNTRKLIGDLPLWASETGYHNAVKKERRANEHNAVPERVAAIYGPRLLAEYLRQGVSRAYFYELIDGGTDVADQEQSFGLLRADFATKPIFIALRDTLRVVRRTGVKGSAALTVEVTAAGDVRSLLLRRSDGSAVLLVWREAKIWDEVAGTPVIVAPVTADIAWKGPRFARLYRPTFGGTRPVAELGKVEAAVLAIDAEITALEIGAAP